MPKLIRTLAKAAFVCGLFASSFVSTAARAVSGEPASLTSPAQPKLDEIADKYFPGDATEVPSKRIFRLTRDQLDATAAILLPGYATQSIKELMPRDPLQTNYEYAELLSFNPANIAPLMKWIGEIAARVGKNPTGLIKCAPKADADCLESEARRFVVRAFRGDAPAKKVDETLNFYLGRVNAVGLPTATADLVEVVLSSPHFLFRKELHVDRRGNMAAAPLLQALSYTIGDAPPEKFGLNSVAALEHVQTPDRRDATIDAMLASKEARGKLMRFFKAWLEVKEPQEFSISTKVFPEFTPKLSKAMVEEVERYLQAQLSSPAPSLKSITQGTRTDVPAALAPIYKIDGAAALPVKATDHDKSQRLGIFSLPAVIASHSGPVGTQLVKRGVFWVRKVMCMDLQPPPPDAHKSAYAEVVTTERQRIEQSTRTAACYGCHKVINPLGYFQENYDPIGRWRTLDNGHPVDASIDIGFLDEPNVRTQTPVEALAVLTNSHMFKQCFVRQMFRYYMGRKEEPGDDPVLRDMFTAFAGDEAQNIMTPLRMLVSSTSHTRRQ